MILKYEEVKHRRKMELSKVLQTYDTILLTQQMIIESHKRDKDERTRESVKKTEDKLAERLDNFTLSALRELYLYNDEQIMKNLVKYFNAPFLQIGNKSLRLVNRLLISTTRARMVLRRKMGVQLNKTTKRRKEKIAEGKYKLIFRDSKFAEMEFRPEWMTW